MTAVGSRPPPTVDRFSWSTARRFFPGLETALFSLKGAPDSRLQKQHPSLARISCGLSRQPAPRPQRPLARRRDGQRATGRSLPRSSFGKARSPHSSANLGCGGGHFRARRAPLRSDSKIARPLDGLPALGPRRFHLQAHDAAARSRRAMCSRNVSDAGDRSAHARHNCACGPRISDEELETLVEMGEEEGTIQEAEGEMIQEIIKLGDKTAKDCMTPRVDTFALPDDLHERGSDRALLKSADRRRAGLRRDTPTRSSGSSMSRISCSIRSSIIPRTHRCRRLCRRRCRRWNLLRALSLPSPRTRDGGG